jgi:hypothetical protein
MNPKSIQCSVLSSTTSRTTEEAHAGASTKGIPTRYKQVGIHPRYKQERVEVEVPLHYKQERAEMEVHLLYKQERVEVEVPLHYKQEKVEGEVPRHYKQEERAEVEVHLHYKQERAEAEVPRHYKQVSEAQNGSHCAPAQQLCLIIFVFYCSICTGKGSGPVVEALENECLDDGPGGIPSCCFDGCRGRPTGLDQPSGTQCSTCDCDCPPIPEVFQCPFSPPPEPIIQEVTPCIMSASVQCYRNGRNGSRRPCADIRPMQFLQCSCPSSCASTFEFMYTAKSCGERPVAGASNCRDFGGEMPDTVGVIGTIRGREFYYNDNVKKDDKITFQDGNCIKNEMSLAVVDRNDRDRILQTIDLRTRCDDEGISLGDRFGAFEFTAYTCHDGTIQNCIKNLSFEVCAVNEKPSALSVSVMELDVKGQIINMLGDVSSLSVAADEASCSEEIREISICRTNNLDFVYLAYVEGSERNSPGSFGSFGSHGSSSSSDSDSGDVQSASADVRCSAEASARFHVDPPGLPPVGIFQETSEPSEPEPTREPRRDEPTSPRGKGGGARGYGRFFGRDYYRPRNAADYYGRGKGF